MEPRQQIRIFLDIDGVLADFEGHMHAEGKAKPDGTPKWDDLDHNWWVGIPVFDGAREFYAETKKLAVVKFLTAPVPMKDSFSGKAQWVEAFGGGNHYILKDLTICHAEDKALMARPHHILVDDRIKNIEEWRTAGGIGIHHKGDFADTLKKVQKSVDKLGGPMPFVFKKAAKKKAPEPK